MNGLFSGHELVEAKHAEEIETHGRVEATSTVRSESTPQSGKGALLDGLSCSGHKAEDLLYKGSLRQHVTPGHGTHLSLGQHRHCQACRKVFSRSVCERIALCRTCRIAWQPKHTTRRWAGLRSRRARPPAGKTLRQVPSGSVRNMGSQSAEDPQPLPEILVVAMRGSCMVIRIADSGSADAE
jgi:hypothetical protein